VSVFACVDTEKLNRTATMTTGVMVYTASHLTLPARWLGISSLFRR
jgi:hypothetical protein